MKIEIDVEHIETRIIEVVSEQMVERISKQMRQRNMINEIRNKAVKEVSKQLLVEARDAVNGSERIQKTLEDIEGTVEQRFNDLLYKEVNKRLAGIKVTL